MRWVPRLEREHRVQLLRFDVDGDRMLLDCLVNPPAQVVMPGNDYGFGEPVAIVVSTPGLNWLSAALASLGRWADEGCSLGMVESSGRVGTTVTISHGASSVMFDVLQVSGYTVLGN